MIRWIFLDIGGVILDEDVLAWHVFSEYAHAIRARRADLATEDLIAEREDRALAGSRWPTFDLASAYLPPEEVSAIWDALDDRVRRDYAAFLPPLAGAIEAIAELSGGFRLGLIANQPARVRDVLEGLDLLDRFEVVCLSEEIGLSKPDPAIFSLAMDRAGSIAPECLMVGDRPAIDLEPARRLGLRTAWIRGDSEAGARTTPSVAFRRSLRRIEAAAAVQVGLQEGFASIAEMARDIRRNVRGSSGPGRGPVSPKGRA